MKKITGIREVQLTPDTNQLLLTFEDNTYPNFIKAVCRRKGYTIESYIVDNMEWDDMPECLSPRNKNPELSHEMCYECEYSDTCPDSLANRSGGE